MLVRTTEGSLRKPRATLLKTRHKSPFHSSFIGMSALTRYYSFRRDSERICGGPSQKYFYPFVNVHKPICPPSSSSRFETRKKFSLLQKVHVITKRRERADVESVARLSPKIESPVRTRAHKLLFLRKFFWQFFGQLAELACHK